MLRSYRNININYPDEFPGNRNKNLHITFANALKLYAVEKMEKLGIASAKKEVKLTLWDV